jgi:hypothetical protein
VLITLHLRVVMFSSEQYWFLRFNVSVRHT